LELKVNEFVKSETLRKKFRNLEEVIQPIGRKKEKGKSKNNLELLALTATRI
tara:strand:+ start:150 stop:305 length:156 start_codon:yes stop_codon:yes gene_type:complete